MVTFAYKLYSTNEAHSYEHTMMTLDGLYSNSNNQSFKKRLNASEVEYPLGVHRARV